MPEGSIPNIFAMVRSRIKTLLRRRPSLTVIITLMVFGPSIATATDHHMAARQRMNLADPQKTTMPSVPKAGTLCPTKSATALAWTYPNAVIGTTEML